MTYIDKEKSSLKPIFMALSLVAVIGFGIMYFMFSKLPGENAGMETGVKTSTPAVESKPLQTKTVHTHV